MPMTEIDDDLESGSLEFKDEVMLTNKNMNPQSFARMLYRQDKELDKSSASRDKAPSMDSPLPLHANMMSRFGFGGVKINDGRLHPEYPLYCEGMAKPKCRGYIHLICTLLLPLAYYHLYLESNGNVMAIVSSGLYIFSNMWCYGFSAIYHIGMLSVFLLHSYDS